MKSLEHQAVTVIFSLLGLLLLTLAMFYGTAHFLNSLDNETESDNFSEFLNGDTTSPEPTYQNIEIIDKQCKIRSLMSDVYNVVFKTENGDIMSTNNMSLYYSVEKGHVYNASFLYGFRGIVGEVQ